MTRIPVDPLSKECLANQKSEVLFLLGYEEPPALLIYAGSVLGIKQYVDYMMKKK